jgi:hypothetical protein
MHSYYKGVLALPFLFPFRVIFQLSNGPCAQTCEFKYVEMKGSKSASGRLALGNEKGCQSQKHA